MHTGNYSREKSIGIHTCNHRLDAIVQLSNLLDGTFSILYEKLVLSLGSI